MISPKLQPSAQLRNVRVKQKKRAVVAFLKQRQNFKITSVVHREPEKSGPDTEMGSGLHVLVHEELQDLDQLD